MAVKYSVKLEKDDNGTILVTFPDYPGATFGEDREEGLLRAVDALETVFIGYMGKRQDIPEPSKVGKGDFIILPPISEAKVELYKQLRRQGVRKAELAKRLGWHLPQVDRLLDLRHDSRMDQLEKAFAALGKRIVISIEDAA
jgi:antitoxin HicB